MITPYEEVDKAYKAGIRAGLHGKSIEDNPYEQSKKATRSQTAYGSWLRGWLAGRRKRKTI